MHDWIAKLDEFLKASGRELLDHAGSVSAEAARAKAEQEYSRYHALIDAQPRAVDAEFEKVAKELQAPRPASPRGSAETPSGLRPKPKRKKTSKR